MGVCVCVLVKGLSSMLSKKRNPQECRGFAVDLRPFRGSK